MMRKRILSLMSLLLVVGHNAFAQQLTMVDEDATAETKALYANLWEIQKRGFIFGHHDDLMYGRYWYGEQGNSDTKQVCGDYPGVYSMDFAEIMMRGNPNSEGMKLRRRCIEEARRRGEIIMGCCHIDNPLTGRDAWDNSNNYVLKQILNEGSDTHARFYGWLDNVIAFVKTLKDDEGRPIPIIFRPLHEHTQVWNWWGSKCATEAEFVAVWRRMVDYIKANGVHQFIYCISPQSHRYDDAAQFLYRWPGDDYVDMIGYDFYEQEAEFGKMLEHNLKVLSRISRDKRKPCAVTETGLEAYTNPQFWTEHILKAATAEGVNVSFITTWRNKFVDKNEQDTHYFSIYPGHPAEADFVKFYQDKRTFFGKDLPDMYTLSKH
jgi:mannan endo-1,4-beta-mannosidase